jgi:hypothetical protein
MSKATHPPETDLILPRPAGEDWDPHTIHTHYFGLSVPAAALGAFIYVRYQPTFPLCQGGVCIFRGLEGNTSPIDMEFLDYEITMPWPEIDGNTITTANGLRIEFTEPGRAVRLSYASNKGEVSFDLEQTAVTPLLVRGHVMPGEDLNTDPGQTPGGSEQFMKCRGELTVRGERYDVDCFSARDRSWRQTRTERQGAVPVPPVGWSPMCFGEDLIFNQISFEGLDTDPAWAGLYEVPADRPTHHFAWLQSGDETREIVRVRRNVTERHPQLFAATRQEIEAEDEHGGIHRFQGEAIAMTAMPAWPNVSFRDSVYRWEDERGRVAHQTYQEIWFDTYQRAMQARARDHVSA